MTALVLAAVTVAGLVLNGLRLRSRVPSALPAAAPAGPPAGLSAGDTGAGLCLTAPGVRIEDAARQAAVARAHAEDLDLLDLVPARLPVTAARDLLRAVDPHAYPGNRLAPGRSAGAAVLVSEEAAGRAALIVPDGPVEPADLIAVVRRARPYAKPHGTAIAIVPGVAPGPDDLSKRAARLRASGAVVAAWQVLDAIPWLLTVASLTAGWEWGLAAAVVYSLQPYLIFAGTPLRPRGLHCAALGRLLHAPYVWVRTTAGRWRSAAEKERAEEIALSVPYYRDALAGGTSRFFQARTAECPWCGSSDLSVVVRSPDLVMGKPGMFTLERCGGCGHVFQNPRLRPEGLSFYYRDAYDGLSAADAEFIFATGKDTYAARARMVEPHLTPKAWLDVGAGHAHFCAIASEVWPGTVFDGLDQGAVIEDAQRRGWISTAYRGEFRELTATLAGRYDVISMHHYLEHTVDPRDELDAAARVLLPGGYLLIELPDPEWRLARLLRQYWMAWYQPQHLSMIPLENLTRALDDRGFTPIAIERGTAHQANDFVSAAALLLSRIAPDRGKPWSQSPDTRGSRTWRAAAWTCGIPFIMAGLLLDRTVARQLARHTDRGNAYRVLSRKEDSCLLGGPHDR